MHVKVRSWRAEGNVLGRQAAGGKGEPGSRTTPKLSAYAARALEKLRSIDAELAQLYERTRGERRKRTRPGEQPRRQQDGRNDFAIRPRGGKCSGS